MERGGTGEGLEKGGGGVKEETEDPGQPIDTSESVRSPHHGARHTMQPPFLPSPSFPSSAITLFLRPLPATPPPLTPPLLFLSSLPPSIPSAARRPEHAWMSSSLILCWSCSGYCTGSGQTGQRAAFVDTGPVTGLLVGWLVVG